MTIVVSGEGRRPAAAPTIAASASTPGASSAIALALALFLSLSLAGRGEAYCSSRARSAAFEGRRSAASASASEPRGGAFSLHRRGAFGGGGASVADDRRRTTLLRPLPAPRRMSLRDDDGADDDDGVGSGSPLSNPEIARYSRHLVLSDVGMSGQRSLRDASVLVIGAGGLGSPCLLYLAAAGVGRLGIVDADTVDESNLQRQIIHGTSTVGASKCESARARIADVNPHVRVRTYEEEFTSATALRILGDGFEDGKRWDAVVDGSDNFPTKYLINDACDLTGVPWVYSAILAFEGQLSTFNHPPGIGPTYRDMMPTPPPPGDVPSCAEGGVLGVLPGTMGCLQATEVIKIVLGKDEGLLRGRVLVYDAMTMKFGEVGLVRSEDREEVTGLIDYQGFCAGHVAKKADADSATEKPAGAGPEGGGGRTMDEAETASPIGGTDGGDGDDGDAPSFRAVEPAECLAKLADGWTPWVLDVRLQTENDIVALPFTDRVSPHRTVVPSDVPKSGDVLVYCKAGVRGRKACDRLIELGIEPERLYNLEGGIMRWQKDLDQSMPRY